MSSGSQEDVLLVVHSTAAQPHADRLHLVEENVRQHPEEPATGMDTPTSETKFHPRPASQRAWRQLGLGLLLAYAALHLLTAAIINFQRALPLLATAAFIGAVKGGKMLLAKRPRTERFNTRVMQFIRATLMAAAGGIVVISLFKDPSRITSLMGLMLCFLLSYLACPNPSHIRWRIVGMGFALQYILAAITLQTKHGQDFFLALGTGAERFLSFTYVGSDFVFSRELSVTAFVAFRMLPSIVFFSAVSSLLFHLGAVQWVVNALGGLMETLMGTSALESVCAAANIFLGQSEAPLLIAPFIQGASVSELHAIMTSGFSTVAGGVLAAYISLGVPSAHLIGASVISAPAALVFAKILCPETHPPEAASEHGSRHVTQNGHGRGNVTGAEGGDLEEGSAAPMRARGGRAEEGEGERKAGGEGDGEHGGSGPGSGVGGAQYENMVEAAAAGAVRGVQLAASMVQPRDVRVMLCDAQRAEEEVVWAWTTQMSDIGGMLITFVALEAFADASVSWWFGLVGHEEITISTILGWLFWVPAWLMGVPAQDCREIGRLVALKTILNEFVAYSELIQLWDQGAIQKRSFVIATYALCGFSNFGSIGVQLAGLTAIAPSRAKDLARHVISALLGGFFAYQTPLPRPRPLRVGRDCLPDLGEVTMTGLYDEICAERAWCCSTACVAALLIDDDADL